MACARDLCAALAGAKPLVKGIPLNDAVAPVTMTNPDPLASILGMQYWVAVKRP
eukprot:CAMPEP_0179428382 /NCGR_PEP_ID=MMETSP0799-20121207/14070_1 /TAXON_ID=46947 /ORGANISM="Geminigera cryophila, Strain CCMP2564" /LENGTH=53 /DNA_ID=CAMNT_0021203853 /DNA_START=686 /DNA_END=847 /DNA_ORIENTATION=-